MRVLLVLCFCLSSVGCLSSDCENTVLAEVNSPDGKKVASLFEHGCGATTPFVQVVTIREYGTRFEGNDTEDFIFTMQGQQKIEVQWEGDNRLVIKRPPNAGDIFKELKSWNGVEISYN